MKVFMLLCLVALTACEAPKVEFNPPPDSKLISFPDPVPAAPKLLGVHLVVPHDTLWGISGQWYHDPVLWPAIYEINKGVIRDPDLIYVGQRFDIPELGGDHSQLSGEDKVLLQQGFLDAYRVYKEKGRQDAEDYNPAN